MLVCLDRSPFAELCLPYAISLGRTFGSNITLLHVMQTRHENGGQHTTGALNWEISRQEARGYLDRIEAEVSAGLGRPVEVRLEQGHPAERIVDVAREIGADLAVLASHGEGGVTAWNLGSTVQQVLAVTRCSVFVAHASSTALPSVSTKRVLVPLDGSLRTESVLPIAARIADGGEMLLVHVVQEPLASAILHSPEDLQIARDLAARVEAGAKVYLESLRERLPREVASVRTLVVRHANERQCLLEISQREHMDLIVLSAHGVACDAERPYGSVTAHLLTHSMVPLLVLQDLPESERRRSADVSEEPAPPLRASYPPETV